MPLQSYKADQRQLWLSPDNTPQDRKMTAQRQSWRQQNDMITRVILCVHNTLAQWSINICCRLRLSTPTCDIFSSGVVWRCCSCSNVDMIKVALVVEGVAVVATTISVDSRSLTSARWQRRHVDAGNWTATGKYKTLERVQLSEFSKIVQISLLG